VEPFRILCPAGRRAGLPGAGGRAAGGRRGGLRGGAGGAPGDGFVRVTIGTSSALLAEITDRMAAAVAG
jgi:hypothetical protein